VRTQRGELVLRRAGEDFEVISNGVFLMDTRDGRSERLLVRAALDLHRRPQSVLIGGLGVGFSLAEAVTDARLRRIAVVEVERTVVDWHRGALAGSSAGALDDPRVRVLVTDIRDRLRGDATAYDVICLDVDNGPDWTVTQQNAGLYDDAGTQLLFDRLTGGGVLAVWSAHPVPAYDERLRRHADDVRVLTVPVPRREPDVVYLARTTTSA
jgi:spermidine synthase